MYMMKRYSVAEARQRFAALLDAAEHGDDVVIERRGVRFELKVRRASRRKTPSHSIIEYVDPAVEAGQWNWQQSGDEGLAFSGSEKRRQ